MVANQRNTRGIFDATVWFRQGWLACWRRSVRGVFSGGRLATLGAAGDYPVASRTAVSRPVSMASTTGVLAAEP